ncbi:alpha/beta hydrolase [Embleya sp. NBC_00896]|uniref:alpha/beta hydrolase n=1 Tax=Embleya sp. NBC_00896 TaxID=2975961 RepID=UPI003864E885|nr:alpha/beta hydrolase family protein [Embleya sp. NBC_00896]
MHGRLRMGLVAALIAGALVGPGAGVAEAAAPVPPTLPAMSAATLDARYDANQRAIAEAAGMARDNGHEGRADKLARMADPARKFLSFDGRARRVRAVEVVGDLAGADRIAVLVPGTGSDLDHFDTRGDKPYSTPGGGARALYAEIRAQDPTARVAVIAWLGYSPPATIGVDVLTSGRAETGARELRRFIAELYAVAPAAQVSLLCHSYGSTVCGRAVSEIDVADLAVFGSPGLGVDDADDLGTGARVWAGRGGSDWIDWVPNVRIPFFGTTIGFGADPSEDGFGARDFAVGGGGHSDYLRPGGPSLHNLALIARGRATEVTHG